MSRGKIIKEKNIGNVIFSQNTPMSIDQLIDRLKTIKKKAKQAKNTKVKCFQSDSDYDGYIAVTKQGLESPQEHAMRIDRIILDWRRNYEQFLIRYMFFLSPLGKAQIKEVLKRSKVPIWNGYPGSDDNFKRKVREIRKKFEE